MNQLESEIIIKEQEARLHEVVVELVAIKSTLSDVAMFISRPRNYGDMLMLEIRLNQRKNYLDRVIDNLLQPIDTQKGE